MAVSRIIPYLLSPDCEKHIGWLKKVFEVEVEDFFLYKDTKKIMHASLSVNGAHVYLADDYCSEELKYSEPDKKAKSDRGLMCCVEMKIGQGQGQWRKAVENGAKVKVEYKQQEWGDYLGIFEDPFGFEWMLTEEETEEDN